MLEHGANVEQKNIKQGNTALHIACENADLEAVKILVGHGALMDMANKEKETPMSIASRTNGEIYAYMREVWEDKEKQAKMANDELVKQEEIMEQQREKGRKGRGKGRGKLSSFKEEDLKGGQVEGEDNRDE